MNAKTMADALLEFKTEVRSRKIVVFREDVPDSIISSLAQALALPAEEFKKASDDEPMYTARQGTMRVDAIRLLRAAVVVGCSNDDLDSLLKSKFVQAVIPDEVVGVPEEMDSDEATVLDNGSVKPISASAGYSPALVQVGVPWNHELRGQGIAVAVVDTGIDNGHADLTHRVAKNDWKDFTASASPVPMDDHGHGTHCAGLVAGPRGQLGGYGVAPACRLIVGRAMRGDMGKAVGSLGDVMKAAAWAVEERGARIVSLSIGLLVNSNTVFGPDHTDLAARLWKAGAVLLASAGNDSRRHDAPPFIARLRQPAVWGRPPVLCIGAVDATNKPASFSNAGALMYAVAPGVDVYSSWPVAQGGPFAKASGTSQACPIVAGLLALMLESNPALQPQTLVAALAQNALKLPHGAPDVGAGLAKLK